MVFFGIFFSLHAEIWKESRFEDFSDGAEYYVSFNGEEKEAALGLRIWTPVAGGLKLLAQDWDFDDNGYIDLFFPNSFRNLSEPYGYIYWHSYSPGSGHEFTRDSIFIADEPEIGGCAFADINSDGYGDIVVAIRRVGPVQDTFSLVFLGSNEGFDTSHVLKLRTKGAEVPVVADINCDGWLDILFANSTSGTPPYLYWGTGESIHPDSMFVLDSLPIEGPTQTAAVADFDMNGYADIAITGQEDLFILYYSSVGLMRVDTFPVQDPKCMAVADLDRDGYFDIILAERGADSSTVYWGSSAGIYGGYLKFYVPVAMAVALADFDGNGLLDLFFARGISPHFLYYQTSPGVFSLMQFDYPSSSIGCSALDLDGDGNKDIVVAEMNGLPYDSSVVYWNCNPDDKTSFYTRCAGRSASMMPLGNLWDRSDRFSYVSSIFNAGRPVIFDSIRYWAHVPAGCSLKVEIRLGTEDAVFGDWQEIHIGEPIEIDSVQYFQYKVDFFVNYTRTTRLHFDSIAIYYRDFPHPDLDIWPNQFDSTYPGGTVDYLLYVRNLGNYVDTFDLVAVSSSGWEIVFYDSAATDTLPDTNGDGIPDTGPLYPDSTFSFTLHIIPPDTALTGQVDTTVVRAVSSIDSLISDSAMIFTIIKRWAGVEITPETQNLAILPGDSAILSLWLVNVGGVPDTFDIAVSIAPEGFVSYLMDSTTTQPLVDHNQNGHPDLMLAPGDSACFVLKLLAPDSVVSAVEFAETLVAVSNADPSQSDTSFIFVSVLPLRGIVIEPDTQGSVKPGQEIRYRMRVYNAGNTDDVAEISLSGGRAGWSYILLDSTACDTLRDTDIDGNPDLGTLPPYSGPHIFYVSVSPPITEQFDVVDTLKVVAFSGSSSVGDTVQIVTTVMPLELGIEADPDTVLRLHEAEEVDLDVRVIWNGEVADLVEIMPLFGDLTPWEVSITDTSGNSLQDADSDGWLDLGFLEPGDTAHYLLKVVAPNLADLQPPFHVSPSRLLEICAASDRWYWICDTLKVEISLISAFNARNIPNPFRDRTRFIFFVPEDGEVSLIVFDRTGKRIKTLLNQIPLEKGYHSVTWDGRNEGGSKIAPGTYVYVVEVRGENGVKRLVKKVVLVR